MALKLKDDLYLALLLVMASDLSPRVGKPTVSLPDICGLVSILVYRFGVCIFASWRLQGLVSAEAIDLCTGVPD